MLINEGSPKNWRQLQEDVALILRECGMEAETDHHMDLVRGRVNVDVYARDPTTSPALTILCECKNWRSNVTKNHVHAFRIVVADSGANRGFVIASKGFQAGAYDAAYRSNVELVSWAQFQETFLTRWVNRHMLGVFVTASQQAHDYTGTEPVNMRVARQLDGLTVKAYRRFIALRERHSGPLWNVSGLLLAQIFLGPVEAPDLPLRDFLTPYQQRDIPSDVLDAVALRPFMERSVAYFEDLALEFDAVFGRRV